MPEIIRTKFLDNSYVINKLYNQNRYFARIKKILETAIVDDAIVYGYPESDRIGNIL